MKRKLLRYLFLIPGQSRIQNRNFLRPKDQYYLQIVYTDYYHQGNVQELFADSACCLIVKNTSLSVWLTALIGSFITRF